MKVCIVQLIARLTNSSALVVGLASAACVFPAGSSTGLEFSWSFTEQVSADQRPRTCEGALVTHVEVRVTDVDDGARTELRRYECAKGYVGPGVDNPPLSEVFFDLRSGTYKVEAVALYELEDEAPTLLSTITSEVVLDHGIVLTPLVFSPASVELELQLRDAPPCEDARARIFYDDPARDLDSAAATEETFPEHYGDELTSVEGIPFSGELFSCALLVDQRIELELDRGAYELELVLDEEDVCTATILADGRQREYDVDLACAAS